MFRWKNFTKQVFQKHFPHAAPQLGGAQDVLQRGDVFDHGLDLGVGLGKLPELIAEFGVQASRAV